MFHFIVFAITLYLAINEFEDRGYTLDDIVNGLCYHSDRFTHNYFMSQYHLILFVSVVLLFQTSLFLVPATLTFKTCTHKKIMGFHNLLLALFLSFLYVMMVYPLVTPLDGMGHFQTGSYSVIDDFGFFGILIDNILAASIIYNYTRFYALNICLN